MTDTYTLLRHFADSWFLLAMLGFFVACILWSLRPGSGPLHADAARSIFRAETTPAERRNPIAATAEDGRDCATCATCTCGQPELQQ